MSWSYNKLEKTRYKKINTFSKEIIITYNLDLNLESSNKSNINEFQILIIKINCPSFKSSSSNNKENNNIKSESNAIPNKEILFIKESIPLKCLIEIDGFRYLFISLFLLS
jgi:hypothetical protein